MKSSEKGFTLIEVIISVTIMVVASGAAGAAIFQIMGNTQRNSDRMTVVRQVENAGYWISRDAQMALSANATDNTTPPDFLVLRWTTWNGTSGNPTDYSARYFFENLTNGTGTLKRSYSVNGAANQTTLIAQYIYYNPTDVANTSNASYQSPVLTVKITALIEQIMESKVYRIKHRPNL